MAELLSDIAIQRELGGLPGWTRRADTLTKTYQFRNFSEAMSFVNRIADDAEEVNHHPDIDIRYNKVLLSLSSHDSGGITTADIMLARAIDAPESVGEDSASDDNSPDGDRA